MAEGIKMVGGDFVINGSGTIDMVTESEKCLRDVGKMLITDVEATKTVITEFKRYNPNYGSLLNQLTINSGMKRTQVLELASDLVYTTIKNYLALQESRSNLSSGEIIVDINFDTYFDRDRPSVLLIPIRFTTAEGVEYNLGEYEQEVV